MPEENEFELDFNNDSGRGDYALAPEDDED